MKVLMSFYEDKEQGEKDVEVREEEGLCLCLRV
jgi:hypothetical protein